MNLTLTPDRSLIRVAGESVRYVLANIEAPLASGKQRLPLNFALVIDRSGSMRGDKLDQARQAAVYALGLLSPSDRIAVVAYDDQIDVLMPSTEATPEAIAAATRRIQRLEARGTTDLAGGWLSGCREIAEYLDGEQIARCLLLTDGLANRGITDHHALAMHAHELRARGIVTSTFGIGADFDEVLLARVAEAGGGTFRLVKDAEEIPGLLREELQEGLDVVAAQAELTIVAPRSVQISSLNDFPLRTRADGATCIQLGDLVSGQTLAPLIRLEFPAGERGARADIRIGLDDREHVCVTGPVILAFEYAGHSANDTQPRDRSVDCKVARLHAARTRRQALSLNRDGDFRGAERAIAACVRRIREYAGNDAELQAIATELDAERARLSRDMDIMDRKHSYFFSISDLKLRSASGASYRRSRAHSMVVVPCSAESQQATARACHSLARAPVALFGRLRVSESWRGFRSEVPQAAVLEPVQENAVVDAAHARWHEEGLRLVLTESQLADNWFSHWHAVGRTAVVSLHQTAELVGVDLAAYVAYEILLNGLNNSSPHYDLLRLAHDETRGCLFDFCADKQDMEIKLQTMHLCASCSGALARLGVDLDEMARATDVVRELARPVRVTAGGRG